jgi:hypothetical protein
VKRTGRGESIGDVVHIVMCISMKTTQGNTLCSYRYLKLAKPKIILSFMLFLLQSQRTEEHNRFWWGGGCTSEKGDVVGKGVGE